MNRPEVDVLLWAYVGDYGIQSPLVLLDLHSIQEIGEYFRCQRVHESPRFARSAKTKWMLDGLEHRWYGQPTYVIMDVFRWATSNGDIKTEVVFSKYWCLYGEFFHGTVRPKWHWEGMM